ncbi:MAG TPA: transporter substrate-binding domain-containing protein [Azospirillaceae bacterium]|nr:transporter substrate-binding domain-containing protein [Azospirillaceae bacterium]
MRRGAGASLLTILLAATPAAGQSLLLVSEENPPFNFTDPSTGEFSGTVTKVLQLVMARAGIDYEIQVHPWQRSYRMAQNQPNTCVFATNRSPEREAQFKWVGPLAEGGWALFARADWPHRIDTLEDARRHVVAVQSGNAVERFLANQGGFQLEPVATRVNFKMLGGGRFDLVATGIINGQLQAKEAGVPVKIVYRLTSSSLELACNTGTDTVLMERMQQALDGLKAEGVVQAIQDSIRPVS